MHGLAKQAYIPDFEIGVSRHKFEGEPSTWELTFALPVPLYFWQPKQGEIAEALANIEALREGITTLEQLHQRSRSSRPTGMR